MVKKKQNKIKIDFENCVIEDRLLQIKNQISANVLALVKVWSVDINPKDSPIVISLVKDFSSKDLVSLLHLKRIQPIQGKLRVLLCSEILFNRDELLSILRNKGLNFDNPSTISVPTHCPGTKDLAQSWSKSYWPLVWKGNPNDQILNDTKLSIAEVKEHLQEIQELSSDNFKSGLPIATSIVDPKTNEVLAIVRDQRHIHPLHHSIMNSIELVSQKEKRRRIQSGDKETNYLCYGYHVYTSHEPCSMCAMALIHSRVARLIYLRPSTGTGALKPSSGEGYTIQNHKLLNSSFEVWEWIGDEYVVPILDNKINV